jgi:hypothetical protein
MSVSPDMNEVHVVTLLDHLQGVRMSQDGEGLTTPFSATIKLKDVIHEIVDLISTDLSESYSLFTFKYFMFQWPYLTHLVSGVIFWNFFG